jgi:hypothetical protein
MRAVPCFRQVLQADACQPSQPSGRVGELCQADDALAIGHLGGPEQRPALNQDSQPGPGGMKAGIERNAHADGSVVGHGTSPRVEHRSRSGSKVPSMQTEGRQLKPKYLSPDT